MKTDILTGLRSLFSKPTKQQLIDSYYQAMKTGHYTKAIAIRNKILQRDKIIKNNL